MVASWGACGGSRQRRSLAHDWQGAARQETMGSGTDTVGAATKLRTDLRPPALDYILTTRAAKVN
jgi:hypothetical protein